MTAPGRQAAGPGSVRIRTTAVATAAVAIALLVASIALVLVLRERLTNDVHTAAELRAEEIAADYALAAEPLSLTVGDAEDQLVQIIDSAGRVVAASQNARLDMPMARLLAGESAELSSPLGDSRRFIAVAAPSRPTSGQFTVVVARSLDEVTESIEVLGGLLIIGLPALISIVAATTWQVVGRALAPVEAIRREVDAISAAGLHRRVPEVRGNDEISRLARTMNLMLSRLETAQARQRRFVADASHELRSPVATIRQHAEVARSHPERTSVRDLAETVLAEDLRMQGLIEDLLLLAEADGPSPAPSHQSVDLDDVVFEEVQRLRATSVRRIDTAGVSGGRVHGDPAQLRRMVRNLLHNAVRHARARVHVALAESQHDVVLQVDDDGGGIPASERERVFERFVRLDDARARDDGGAGLGLAIVAEVAAAHGGDTAIRDSPSGGARIEIRLPRLVD